MFVQSEKFIAWVQHFIHHLAPTGLPGFVLANGLMSSNQPGEGDIRKAIIERCPVPIGTVPIYQAVAETLEKRGGLIHLEVEKIFEVIERQDAELAALRSRSEAMEKVVEAQADYILHLGWCRPCSEGDCDSGDSHKADIQAALRELEGK
jgi:hypothetical protein